MSFILNYRLIIQVGLVPFLAAKTSKSLRDRPDTEPAERRQLRASIFRKSTVKYYGYFLPKNGKYSTIKYLSEKWILGNTKYST